MKENKYPIQCEKCGDMIEPGDGLIYETCENRDGSYDEHPHWQGMCMYGTECANRVIKYGNNPTALMEIIKDKDGVYDAGMQAAARESYSATADLINSAVVTMDDDAKRRAWMR